MIEHQAKIHFFFLLYFSKIYFIEKGHNTLMLKSDASLAESILYARNMRLLVFIVPFSHYEGRAK